MPGHQPAFRPRPGGGFNPGMGSFNEHMDESAMQQAMQQKALGQQASQPSAQQIAQQSAAQQASNQVKPREVGSLAEELFVRPAQDIVKGLFSIFDLNSMLGLSPANTESPEEKAKKQRILQNYNKLTQEDQAFARQKYQERLKRKEAEEKEKMQRRQMEEQQQAQSVVVPSSPKKGPEGPAGNKKQRAVTKLQNDRKTLSGPSSAN